MKKQALVGLIVLVGVLAFLAASPNIKSRDNTSFAAIIIGSEGAKFEGFCTHEVKYIIGSRTQETAIRGEMTAENNTFEFVIPGVEISCKIDNRTPGKSITIVLLKDGTEVNRVAGARYDFYLDYYPPAS